MTPVLTASPSILGLPSTILAARGLLAQTDPVVLGAYITALAAIVPAVIAYLRGQRADNRTLAVTELEAALKARADDVDRLRKELDEAKHDAERMQHEAERMRNDIASLTASVARCEREKDRMRREFLSEIEALRRMINRMGGRRP